MMSLPPRRCGSTLLLLLPLLVACGGYSSGVRPYDDLLERIDLQHVVDLQVERDGTALGRFLSDADPAVRARASFALASVQDPTAVPALIGLLADESEEVRTDAAFAIGQSADSTAAPAIWEALLTESRPLVRARLLEALGKTGGHPDLTRLAGYEADGSEAADLAMAIARFGLRDIHDDAAVERLLTLLAMEAPGVRTAAAYYFGRMGDVSHWAASADGVREALARSAEGEEAAMHLLQALGRLSAEEDVPTLVRWMGSSPDWRIRMNAVRAGAGQRGDATVRRALLGALDDRSSHVALAAAAALAGTEDLTAAELSDLSGWAASHPGRWRVTGALLPAFGRSGDIDLVLVWLDQQRELPSAVSLAAAALALVPGDPGLFALEGLAKAEDSRTSAAAIEALTARWRRDREDPALAGRYFELFERALLGGDLAATYAAAGALADRRFAPLGAVDLLMRAWEWMATPADVEPMTALLGSLARLRDQRAVPLLREATAHEVSAVAAAAVRALRQLTGEVVQSAADNPSDRAIDWERLAEYGNRPVLRLVTGQGTIDVELDPSQAPQTCETILRFAEEGRYDGVPFHRVVSNFVVQGGDFEREDGFGGPGFSIRSEFTRIPYGSGTIGMASAGKDTEGSQYFITHSPQPHLDGRYTAFGTVIRGRELVDLILQGEPLVRAEVVRGG